MGKTVSIASVKVIALKRNITFLSNGKMSVIILVTIIIRILSVIHAAWSQFSNYLYIISFVFKRK